MSQLKLIDPYQERVDRLLVFLALRGMEERIGGGVAIQKWGFWRTGSANFADNSSRIFDTFEELEAHVYDLQF